MFSSDRSPRAWERKSISDLFDVRASGDVEWSRWRQEQDSDHPFPVYANGRANSGLHGYASYMVELGDAITLTARGTPGELGFAFFRATSFTPIGRLLVLRSKGEADARFFTSYINGAVRFVQESTGVAQLTAPQVARCQVDVPPLTEQRAIAEALSDADALLTGMDRLIAKKRELKLAAMQQLFTGQTRLPGFQGEWALKRLAELGTFFKGSGVKKDEANSGDLPCVRYGEIYTHHHECIRRFNSWISPDVAKSATRLKHGDLLFAGSGETKAEIGKCVAFVDAREAYAGGDIVILRPIGTDPIFMGYYLNTAKICAQKAGKGQGDAVVHISAAALGSIAVAIPKLPEQSAIAAILSDIDAELTSLETRRDKTRALKQGMMQELLTGRTRLV
jgi:type I restriction enzyme S subunit